MVRPTYLKTFCVQIDQFAYLRGTLLVGQYDYEVVHRRSKQHANADGLSCQPTQTVKLTIQSVTDDQQVQQPAQVRTKSKIPTFQSSRRNQPIHAMTKSGLPTEARETSSSVNTDEMSLLARELNRQLQSGHAIAKSKSLTEAREMTKSVDTDETSTMVKKCQQFQSDVAEQPMIPSATDDRRSSVPTNIFLF